MTQATKLQALVPYKPSLNECRSVSEILANSRFFSDCRSGSQAVAKVLAGRELGLPPYASMTGIYNVKGRLTFSANAMATLIQKFTFPGTDVNRFKYRIRKKDRTGCTIVFYERESPTGEWEEVGVETFDEEDRKLAALSGDNWKKYPKNMFFARAMSNGAKTYCPAVFGGHQIYTPDELDQRAEMDADGSYRVDGSVVQSMDVQDAEVVSADPCPAEPRDTISVDPHSPLGELLSLVQETGTDSQKICSHYGVSSLDQLDADALQNCMQMLLAKKSTSTD